MAATGGATLNRQLELLAPAGRRERRARRGGIWDAITGRQRRAASEPEATAVLARHPGRELVMRKLRYARGFFPELEGCALRIGLTRRAAGLASPEEHTLWFNPHRLALHTIAHELTHLLQGRGLVPGGERSCDLFAMARHASLIDILPCYLELPGDMADGRGWLRPGVGRLLCDLAREAVDRRQQGLRRYIRWFEDTATRRWRTGDGVGRHAGAEGRDTSGNRAITSAPPGQLMLLADVGRRRRR